MAERYDWRGEVRRRLRVEVEDPDTTDPCIAPRPVIRALYEHARETLGIPKTPPEPTDEELLDEVSYVLGRSWLAVSPPCVSVLFQEATKRTKVQVGPNGPGYLARLGYEHEDKVQAAGLTPAEALRSALAVYLRAEWRRRQGGGE